MTNIFDKRDHRIFLMSAALLVAGFMSAALDPAPYGFGTLTLWIAPPLLLLGFFLPVLAILGKAFMPTPFSFTNVFTDKWKNAAAFLSFIVPIVVYMVTLEPTASLWDCSEFIASAYKLQVPHTPGTPLSLLFGRLFSMLAFGDVTKVALTINMMSAFFSALTVLLLYKIIFFFGEKLSSNASAFNWPLAIAALAGSLTFAFSDSFWFSAVEAETYGIACFFLTLLFWLIIRYANTHGNERTRWVILIFYLAGLSYCVHPMCLLALPAFPFAWYFSHRKFTVTNVLSGFVAGLLLVFAINKFIAIGVFELSFSFDLFFVNSLHLPFYSGAIALILGGVLGIVLITKRFPRLTTFSFAIAFILAGFLPYLLLFIRSNHNPPIDETNPEDLSLVKAYMNRESYPSSPVLFGPYYDAEVVSVGVKKSIYYKGDSQYKIAGTMPEYSYDKERITIFPRLFSNDPNHISSYKEWTGIKANEKPKFIHNLKFLFNYQLGHMYLRYLMFNFVGRESDEQGSDFLKPWEPRRVPGIAVQFQKSRNQYWMIPLLMGLVGFVLQYFDSRKEFITLLIFFSVTGIVLITYLNPTPNEPRERDYIFVGSYIAFSAWIGIGLYCIFRKFSSSRFSLPVLAFSLLIPCWMCYENFDDHNRSGRTFQIDYARQVLNSCAPNSILFTGGDNDTFPLWYLQDVEGFRTDVRVMVLSYFNTDWYINQLRRQYYNSPPLKLTLTPEDYRQYGKNDVLYLQEIIKEPIDAAKYLSLLSNNNSALTQYAQNGEPYSILPSRSFSVKLKSKEPIQNSVIKTKTPSEAQLILKVDGNYLQKNALAIIDLIVSNGFQRPLYFNFTSINGLGLDINPYLVSEGPVYRLTAQKNPDSELRVDTETTYNNLITRADYTNLADPAVFFNFEDYHARIVNPVRQSFNSLALEFLKEGQVGKAKDVLSYAVDHLYHSHLRPSYMNLQAAQLLISTGDSLAAEKIAAQLFNYSFDQISASLQSGKTPKELDVLFAENAAELLDRAEKPSYHQKLATLHLDERH
jgi:hypothetical protein